MDSSPVEVADHGGSRTSHGARLRVILAPSAYYPNIGGIEELTRQLATALAARGHRVTVLTNRWPATTARIEVLDGVTVTRLDFPLPASRPAAAARFAARFPSATARLYEHLRKANPDVVHVIGAGPQAAYIAMFRRLLRARVVLTAQGELAFDAHGVFERSSTMRTALRKLLRDADAVTACSHFVLDQLRSFAPIRPPQSVVPNGVDPDELSINRSESPMAPTHVVAFGRLVPQKGFDVLLDAFACTELESLRLTIAGEGLERGRLTTKIQELGLQGRARLPGAVDRKGLRELLAMADVFALPSRAEPFGIALLEAMAAGVPAVATRAGGVTEFAQHGENALLVGVENPRELAYAISRLTMDDGLRARLTANGLKTAGTLSWKRIAAEYERIYYLTAAPETCRRYF
ncbi:MAG TPA: glycosyltransferase family 4 protein [Gaiellaceae bacterium]|nr:glycosyltransferase family 4 protein [Gaiellaceae bacterium]